MPRYDYRCTWCGIVSEEFHSMTDIPVIVCTHCGHRSERYFGNQALNFKPVIFGFNDKAGARVFNSEREMKDFERRTGRVLLSNEEIDQEQARYKKIREKRGEGKGSQSFGTARGADKTNGGIAMTFVQIEPDLYLNPTNIISVRKCKDESLQICFASGSWMHASGNIEDLVNKLNARDSIVVIPNCCEKCRGEQACC